MNDLTKGQAVRVRRQGSNDDWCNCRVVLVSPNMRSIGLMVEDGAIRSAKGGIVTGFLPVSLTKGRAIELSTMTELEIETLI